MPIKFTCPACQKQLKVKDELAGKKAACPNCKKQLRIPAESAVPASTAAGTVTEMKAEDLEDLASALLAEKKVEEQATNVIEMTCPFCDAEVKLPETMGGKQTPCPECRRIIRVPQLAPSKKKNWQEVAPTGPSLAKPREENLEGAWGSESATRVSTDALYEAGAVKEVRPPITTVGWIKRGVIAAMGLAVLFFGYVLVSNLMKGNLRNDLQDKLTEALPALPAPLQADFCRSRGEYHAELARRVPEKDQEERDKHLQEARVQLGQAVGALGNIPKELERAAACRRLLQSMTECGLRPEEMKDVLQALPAGPIRQGVLRDYIRSTLAAQNETSLPTVVENLKSLVRTAPEQNEQATALGILGLELVSINRSMAQEICAEAKELAVEEFSYAFAVLASTLEMPQGADPPDAEIKAMIAIEKSVRQGRYAEGANKLKENNTLTKLQRTRMLLLLAEAAGKKEKAEMDQRLAQAQELVPEEALAERERIVDLTFSSGDTAQAESRAIQLLDEAAKGRLQLRNLLSHLGQATDVVDTEQCNTLPAGAVRANAIHAVARHNARRSVAATTAWAEALPQEYRAFGLLGVLRGLDEPR
jgi:transposase-like protein